MSLPTVVSRDEWMAARRELLVREKAQTRARDELNAARRRLPMVEITQGYEFTGDRGPVSLADLFAGRPQLIVQHFMFHPDWDAGCPSCTAAVDEVSAGLLRHLARRDTTFAVVARAPYPKIADYVAARGWDVPFYSSYGSPFNYDFHVTLDSSVAPVEYNYRTADEHAAAGTSSYVDGEQPMEHPGMSCFLRAGDRIFHTYSTFARGSEQLGGAYAWLDLTALGRQEDWEEPKGRAASARSATPDFAT